MDSPADPPPFGELAGCFAFTAHRLERRVSAWYDAALRPSGLTVRQFNLLGQAAAAPGMPIQRLARRLLADPTTLTRNLQPLVERGLIVIVPGAHDKRLRCIAPTPAGRAALQEALPLWRQAQAAVAERWGADASALAQRMEAAAMALKPGPGEQA